MRFINQKDLVHSSNWRPFGGGQTLCPGRFMAQQTVLTFVAMVLHKFDIGLAWPQRFSRVDQEKPVLGVMGTLDDVAVGSKLRV